MSTVGVMKQPVGANLADHRGRGDENEGCRNSRLVDLNSFFLILLRGVMCGLIGKNTLVLPPAICTGLASGCPSARNGELSAANLFRGLFLSRSAKVRVQSSAMV